MYLLDHFHQFSQGPFKTPLKASEARWLSTAEGGLKGGVRVKGPRSKAGLAPQALVPFKTPLPASEARWLSTAEGDLKGEVRVQAC